MLSLSFPLVKPLDLRGWSVTNLSGPFLAGEEYLQLPRSPEAWIIEPLIPVAGLSNLYGRPKLGKSLVALQLAAAVASALPDWLSFPVSTPGTVFYLQLDTPRGIWAERLEHFAQGPLPEVMNVLYADSEQAPYPFDILDPSGRCPAWLREQIHTHQPRLVVIDTLREIHRGDENDSGQMANVMAALQACTRPAALLVVSHSRKEFEGQGDGLMESARGSSYVAGRMDSIMRLTPKHLHYQGRTIDESKLKLIHDKDTLLWHTCDADVTSSIAQVMADSRFVSQRAKARRLAELTGRSPQACRRLLQKLILPSSTTTAT